MGLNISNYEKVYWYKGHKGFRYNGTNYKRYKKAEKKTKSPYAAYFVTR